MKKKLAERIGRIEESITIAITAKAKEMNASGIKILSFGAGEPDFDTPDNIKEAAIKAIRDGFTKYTAAGGINELKDAIIEKEKKVNGVEYKRNEICVSAGGKQNLFNLSQVLFEEGDEVIILSPYWVTYEAIVKYANAVPVVIKTTDKTGFVPTQEQLLKAITPKTKAIILNNPSNPTGGVFEKKDLEFLAELALKNDFWVISDEMYESIVYDGYKPVSIASLSKEIRDKTIVINGVSKTYSMTGWRIGYSCGDKELTENMTKLQSQSTSNPTSIAQIAALEALTGPQDSVEVMRKEFEKRRNYIVNALNSINGITCFNPKGAFYVFPNISGLYGKSINGKTINNSMDFASVLLDEAKVAVVPGIGFGDDDYVRLSFATSMQVIQEGIEAIKEFVSKLK
ncbi:MAG: pyridoxal phosphate-dependent aminotransferase [Desulfurella sp.]|uniref:Aminotransferase n=2 Tax=Desulfurella TaxID=33001 RepID=A0A1G6NHN2_9BACT|nr:MULTISPECIES: pyridoxal phosphate-dependent aminotransferase [Desulfurella]AHF97558.1 aspartate aminotransferase [Desulfurella acetivorans A63]HEX14172.1 pyridoxal phosphate-dependent aminotransferase [Desulfurella acetivorans]PMP64282.1 MAG: pyridoxal phosphate-dependent aminotransferase [Desulfurella multipotens]PMP87527.1 MAG: pyridoxal phosphate-dependent aminotransferase [Desulfurella sp.]SDC66914.1 aspartate aminotransferase [Desulfurella multipotens]